MVIVRGVNVFPSSISAVVERFPSIAEYRVTVHRRGELDDLKLEIEAMKKRRDKWPSNSISPSG